MFNLGTVIKFEVVRALKKPTFWLAIFALPLIYAGFFLLGQMAGEQAKETQEKLAKEKFSFEIMDESKILNPQIIESIGGKVSKNHDKSVEKVKSSKINAFYFVPKNLDKDSVKIFAKFEGATQSGKYSAVIENLLKNSANDSVDPNKIAAINGTFSTEEKQFKDGKEYNALREMLVPGMLLAVFYLIAGFLSSRILTSTTEEKENRVTEMILTSISAKTLIVGKIISIMIIGFIQILTLVVPALILAFTVGKDSGVLGFLNDTVSNLSFDTEAIIRGSLILAFGLVMMVGAIIALGSAMPTAQEASQYFGVVVLLLMAPFFTMTAFLSPEKTPVVDFISYFPLTSPIALLLRNTLGTLSNTEAAIGIFGLAVSAIIAIWLAIRIFQYGTLSYGTKVNLKSIFSKKTRA